MKRVLTALLLVLLLASKSNAQPSLLGICHKDWNCTDTVKMFQGFDTLTFGWLENTFDRNCLCAEKLLNDPRPKIVRVHVLNGPCLRNKRCGRYEVFYKHSIASANRAVIKGGKLLKDYKSILKRLAKRLQGVSNLTCYISPCLECDLDGRARRVLADLVSNYLPNCNIVDSPYRRKCISGTICERHGSNPKLISPCIVDLDGIDGTTVDIKKYVEKYNHCDLTYYWEAWMNCNTVNSSQFIDPRKRDCAYPPKTFANLREILCQYFYPSLDTCSR